MNTLVIILVSIAVYCIGMLIFWLYVHKAFGKTGVWQHISPTRTDVIIVFIPVVNFIWGLVGWIFYYPIQRKDSSDKSWFFKINKP